MPCNSVNWALFSAMTLVTLGDGQTAKFLESRWLHGKVPVEIAPLLYSRVRFKNSNVHCALDRNKWIGPIQGGK